MRLGSSGQTENREGTLQTRLLAAAQTRWLQDPGPALRFFLTETAMPARKAARGAFTGEGAAH